MDPGEFYGSADAALELRTALRAFTNSERSTLNEKYAQGLFQNFDESFESMQSLVKREVEAGIRSK
jgi:hypothetical protein